MPAVSNTSPISNLSVIGRLDLLASQFGTVLIPAAVAAELDLQPNQQAKAAVDRALSDGWLRVQPLRRTDLSNLLLTNLDAGEAEAIALAKEIGANCVLLDERAGRSAAARLELVVTGVLGVLLKAKHEGDIPSLKAEITALRSQAGFFIAAHLEETVLKSAGE